MEIVIPGSDMYKICILDSKGRPKRIIVYNGTNAEHPITKDDEIFSEDEKLRIGIDQPELMSSSQQIHKDDSIRIIKKKIIQELGKNNVSYDELYLFSGRRDKLHLLKTFLEMTEQGKNDFNKHMAGQFLYNVMNDPLIDKVKSFNEKINKDVYSYDDFNKEFSQPDDLYNIFVPLGRKFSEAQDLLFSGSPYDILPATELAYQPTKRNRLDLFDNHLLLNYGDITDNTIYVCLAGDVLNFALSESLGEEYIARLYFPLLAEKGILSQQALIENKEELIKQTQDIMKDKTMKIYDVVDLYYNIYNSRTSEIPYIKKGIQAFELILRPEFKTLLPLELIFKQYHTKRHVPYIKYNQGKRHDPIYRLYTTQRTRNGKKIPYLPKTQILALSKLYTNSKARKITLFIQSEFDGTPITIFLEIEYNGNIIVRSELKRPVTVREITDILLTIVNPEIRIINELLESNGYRLDLFDNLKNELLEIISMQYYITVDYRADIRLTEYIDFLSCAFEIIDKNIDKGALLKFKRVENYRHMDAMASMITMALKHNDGDKNIIDLLKVNFLLSEEDAIGKFRDYMSQHVRIGGNYVNKSVNVAENPGFPVILRTVPFENRLNIEVKDINSFEFIDVLNIYIDSFMRITQYPDTTKVTKGEILTLSSNIRKAVDAPHLANVLQNQSTAKPVVDIQPFRIQEEEEEEDEYEEEGGILFEEEDDEEEDENAGILFDEESNESAPNSATESKASSPVDAELATRKLQIGGFKVFFKKLKEKEPELFLIRKEGNYGAYTGICPSNISRQPVILTEDEKKEIDEKYPGSYEVAMPYSTKPDKKFWYICPRYWCVKTNRPMTQEQFERGECNGQTVVDNKNVYEFTDEKEHKDKEGRYRQHRPGFLEKNKHPNFCLPCCFKNMNSDKQIRRREECNVADSELSTGTVNDDAVIKNLVTKKAVLVNKIKKYLKEYGRLDKVEIQAKLDEWEDREYELIEELEKQYNAQLSAIVEKADKKVDKKASDKKVKNVYHILNFDKFPINQHRWGYLQLSLELFLHTDNSTSATKNNPAILKPNERPLLRYGIEQSRHQSFVGCLADIYTYYVPGPTPTIKEMREIIANACSIDIFLKAHNGSLVSVFQPPSVFKMVTDLNVEAYRDTEFYKSFAPADLENPAKNSFLKYTIVSYENFLKFLRDDDSFIDHTYLWDIVTMKETELFGNGLNLVIMEITQKDITDNVELICPTNSYADQLFYPKKGTVLIVKQDEFYEPIYAYGNTYTEPNTNTRSPALKVFQKKDAPRKLLEVLETIQRSTNSMCAAKPSIKKYSKSASDVVVYEYKENLPALKIRSILMSQNFVVLKQVLNYRGKTIGLMVSENGDDPAAVYVPTLPSSIISDLERVFIDDVVWLPFETTFNKLKSINEVTKSEVRSRPYRRIVEDGLIVGIMTETNQFVQIAEPFENNDAEKYGKNNFIEISTKTDKGGYHGKYNEIDKQLATSAALDGLRETTVRNISLETHFYLAFRIRLRSILNDYANKDVRKKIVDIIDNPSFSYVYKLKKLNETIESLMTTHISFVEIAESALAGISTFATHNDIKNICFVNKDVLCVPSKNLTNGQDNNVLYYNRISDELLRYNRIRLFLLDPKRYLNITDIDYSIRDDEIVLLQSILYGNYFDDMEPFFMNEYIQNINYDMANPALTSERFNNKVGLTEQKKCVSEITQLDTSETGRQWHTVFPDAAKVMVYRNSPICSFDIMIDIIQKITGINQEVQDIKVTLLKQYEIYIAEYGKSLNVLLSNQGKAKFINMIKTERMTYETMIMSESYFLTNLDLWLLARAYNIPIVLFSSNPISNMVEGVDWIILNGQLDSEFMFIHCEGVKSTEMRDEYKVMTESYSLSKLAGLEAPDAKRMQSFDDFIKTYVPFKLVIKNKGP